MKPDEARRRQKAREQAELMHSDKVQQALTDAPDKPTPHLVPTEADKTHTLREYRRLNRLAAGERGEKRNYYLDRAVVELVRLVWIERVLALDELQRAALTPAQLVMLSMTDRDEIRDRFDALQDGSEVPE